MKEYFYGTREKNSGRRNFLLQKHRVRDAFRLLLSVVLVLTLLVGILVSPSAAWAADNSADLGGTGSLNTIQAEDYTVYTADTAEDGGICAVDNTFVSSSEKVKKIMRNGTVVSDFAADAAFRIGEDGNLKAGIIFRAQSVGAATDEMEGYSCVLYKTPGTTGDYSRMVLLVYKWARQADGSLSYMGTVGSHADVTTLSGVYQETSTDLAAGADIPVRLHVAAFGTVVRAYFDVYDGEGQIAASSEAAVFDLTQRPTGVSTSKNFTEDAYQTVFNAGAIGVSLSSKGTLCDLTIREELWDYASVNSYSYDDHTLNWRSEEDYFYSSTGGYKQAVLTGSDISDFVAAFDLKTWDSGEVCNMGFDFCIDEETHSGKAYNTTSATMGYEGYRLVLVRNGNSAENPAGTTLYLFRFTKSDSGYTRTTLKTASNKAFFSDYSSADTSTNAYGLVTVSMEVKVQAGVLTAAATMKEHPDKTITLTYDGIKGSGAVGYFIANGGYVMNPSVTCAPEESLITVAESEHGFVYAAINSGAASVGEQVKVIPVAEEGYTVWSVKSTVEGVAVDIPFTEAGYVFEKIHGATAISAVFSIWGDLDNDGQIDGTDLGILHRVLLEQQSLCLPVGDLTGDGGINIVDLVRLKKLMPASP